MPICLQLTESTPIELGPFSGVLYLGEELLSITEGTIGTETALTFTTSQYSYAGTIEGGQGEGIRNGQATSGAASNGTWTLERTNDESCP